MLDRVWDKIEFLMEKIEKNFRKWTLKNEDKIYMWSLIITALMMIAAFFVRGYLALGGEFLFPILPWALVSYIKATGGVKDE